MLHHDPGQKVLDQVKTNNWLVIPAVLQEKCQQILINDSTQLHLPPQHKKSTQASLKCNAEKNKIKLKKKITISIDFLKILAFGLPGIPQEVWVSSSKPANLVNWYCRNQQWVWLAHKTTGETN